MFVLFDASDLVARILTAVFGTLLIPLVYCIYRLGYLSRAQTLLVALFIAISPDMGFFSRFLRHNILCFFSPCCFLSHSYIILNGGQSRYVLIGAIATAGALACKEEMPILLLIFAAFFGLALWKKTITLPRGRVTDVEYRFSSRTLIKKGDSRITNQPGG